VEKQLSSAIDELRPERRLSRFIDARARSADYRGQLGLVSLARRDFQELSDIFADAEALQQRIEEQPKEKERLRKLYVAVDRIILFVDDLDRCEPEKVVDVLQAVHLLLAYPLFGVVVGVDQRCLKQSLRIRFKGLLTPEHRNGSGVKEGLVSDEDELPATPLDYLEKIFHVPFHLPPMDEHGFATFVEKLTEPASSPPTWVMTADNDKAAPPAVETPSNPADQAIGELQQHPVGATDQNAAPGRRIGDDTTSAKDRVPDHASPQLVGSVPLNRWERDALKDYYLLIHTPRGATRLLNTYRLVRAGVPAEEWDSFRGDERGLGEFRIAMLLLAAAAGQPAVAREWFGLLRTAHGTLPEHADGTNSGDWVVFRKLYCENANQKGFSLTNEFLAKWIDRVERFTF
jgi:KAP-like P-loop domain-containing protein